MNISGIVKSSLIDYPGLVSCVLFVPGCNYNCFFCHNRSLIDGTHILMSPRYVEDFLRKRANLLDGVVVSGGEPTLQNDLIPFMGTLKSLGYRVKLDTNGSRPEVVEEILRLGLCNYFAVDYKAPAEQYPKVCGKGSDAGQVIRTIQLLAESSVPFEVRTTVIPQLDAEDLMKMTMEIPAVPRYVLNRYIIPDKYLPEDEDRVRERPLSDEEIRRIVSRATTWQPNIIWH